MSLLSIAIQQIMLPPPRYIDGRRVAYEAEDYYTNEGYAQRKLNRERAIAALHQGGPMDSATLAAALGIEVDKARHIFSGLVQTKSIERLEDGRYRVLEACHA